MKGRVVICRKCKNKMTKRQTVKEGQKRFFCIKCGDESN